MQTLVYLLMIHWLADFKLQNNWMALGKSKRWLPLLAHVSVYSACFIIPCGWTFAGITFLLHLATDYVTSRWTSKLWFIDGVKIKNAATVQWRGEAPANWTPKDGSILQWSTLKVSDFEVAYNDNRHNFFEVIGLDQLIHTVCLAATWIYLFGG